MCAPYLKILILSLRIEYILPSRNKDVTSDLNEAQRDILKAVAIMSMFTVAGSLRGRFATPRAESDSWTASDKILWQRAAEHMRQQPIVSTYRATLVLDKKSAAVTHSVQLLEEKGFLRTEKPEKGVTKPLRLTDKGAAVVLAENEDIDVVTFLNGNPHIGSPEQVKQLQAIFPDNQVLNNVYKKICRYQVNNNLFDKNGNVLIDKEQYKHYWITILLDVTMDIWQMYREEKKDINFEKWENHVIKRGVAPAQIALIKTT